MSTDDGRLVSGARELTSHEVLVVDGDSAVQRGLVQLLAPAGLHVTAVDVVDQALDLLAQKFFSVVVVDLDTPIPNAGLELVKKVHHASPTSIVVVLSPRKTFDGAVAAFRAGAQDVIVKAPDQVDYLKERILRVASDAPRRTGPLLAEIREHNEDFLKRFMDAERRALDLEDKAAGRDLSRTDIDEEMRVLFVDSDERLYQALVKAGMQMAVTFTIAHTGGEALDRVSSSRFHIALVAETLPDLPGSMVIKALKAQAPDLIAIAYELGGRLEIIETSRSIPIVDKFTSADQLASRLGELGEAHRAKGRERRYLQAFRDRHYDFLRRFAELRKKLDRAISETS